MEELLAQLTKKARLECEESHRQKVAATNALAGLDIIQSQVRLLLAQEENKSCHSGGHHWDCCPGALLLSQVTAAHLKIGRL